MKEDSDTTTCRRIEVFVSHVHKWKLLLTWHQHLLRPHSAEEYSLLCPLDLHYSLWLPVISHKGSAHDQPHSEGQFWKQTKIK